jgi:hypothetical protein
MAKFAASNVHIRRVFLVDCDACGEAVDDGNSGHGALTRGEAEQAKKDHVEWHRRPLASEPDPPRSQIIPPMRRN